MTRRFAFLLVLPLLFTGCRSAYYSTWEKLGWAKRDLLVDRVEDARNDQQKAKEQFKTTLQRFQELTGFSGGDLEATYKKLNSEYESAKSRAETVTKRVESVDQVAQDMFKEWEKELAEYQSAELKNASRQKLQQTKDRYAPLIAALRRSSDKMQPVLTAFHDQVLFLKHNLNAQAISSLQTTSTQIEGEVQTLIKDMEASIAEANKFIDQMKG